MGDGGVRGKSRVGWNLEKSREARESLVISISIPSTACAVRQPVCPNKQPAEGGCLIITSPLSSHPEFTFHLTINTRPGLWPCPLSPLEFRDVSGASKATIHMLFSTWWWQYSTRLHPVRRKQKHSLNSCSLPLEQFSLAASTAWCIYGKDILRRLLLSPIFPSTVSRLHRSQREPWLSRGM